MSGTIPEYITEFAGKRYSAGAWEALGRKTLTAISTTLPAFTPILILPSNWAIEKANNQNKEPLTNHVFTQSENYYLQTDRAETKTSRPINK